MLLEQRRLDEGSEVQYREELLAAQTPIWPKHKGLRTWDRFSCALSRSLKEAELSCRTALGYRPSYAEAQGVLGAVLMLQGDNDAALASCQKAVWLKPELPDPHCNLGSILVKLGRLEEAIASCQTSIRLKPDHAEAHHNLGTSADDSRRQPTIAGQLRPGRAA